jgi:isoleucyl-tRNA synthetase
MTKEAVSFSNTVLLPKTNFPMRADLPKREPLMLDFWNKIGLYDKMLETRKNCKPFIHHDGPPYANGHIHVGHVLNKVLKDIVLKSHAMSGRWTPYTPGWDCHGLPIEQNLLKELKQNKRQVEADIPGFRKKARAYAKKYVDLQREDMKRLGIICDWDDPYITMSPDYEGTIVKAFHDLVRKDYIFKGKKTIYWCISCETALADAEVEYHDHKSPSIYVRFELLDKPAGLFGAAASGELAIVIWTTTPWTLPSNMAAAVAKDENYRVLKDKATGRFMVVADKLADAFMADCSLDCEKLGLVPGEKLVGLGYRQPIFPDKVNKIIHTDFVAMDTGSGIVHIAPGHGEDDFYAGLHWKLDIFCPVDAHGKFTKEGGEFEGLTVWEANPKVIEKLTREGKLLASKEIDHSYPHCWRCHKPVIFRATEQWFLGVDRNGLREKLLAEIDKVEWIPAGGHARIKGMVTQRPDWCLSRQRYWGVPVPMITCADCGGMQTDEKLFEAIEKRAFAEGTDFWYTDPVEKIIPAGYKCKCGSANLKKEQDVLDVWLDSGVSWMNVLKTRQPKDAPALYPADLYLEGSDQHRGWFQTSLIPSVALEGKAPFKTVVTHGFLLDEQGKAMHKSAGNAIAPEDMIKKFGAETLRMWVALGDYSEDVKISEKLLEGPIDTYRKIRNTVRYMLGNLWDFRPEAHRVSDAGLTDMDRYMKQRLSMLVSDVRRHYGDYHFRQAIRALADFCILDLSSFYLDALKDRLYTLGEDSPARRSAQTVLYDITSALLRLMAPIVSFTAEEAWQEFRKTDEKNLAASVFLADLPAEDNYSVPEEVYDRWTKMREIRETVQKALEMARQGGLIGSSLEAQIIFKTSNEKLGAFIKDTLPLWPAVAIVSKASLSTGDDTLEVAVEHASGEKCPRCWQWKEDIGSSAAQPQVCARCAEVLERTGK